MAASSEIADHFAVPAQLESVFSLAKLLLSTVWMIRSPDWKFIGGKITLPHSFLFAIATLKIQNQNLVRLAEELEVAHSYLGLYKARFGEKLVFSFENDKPTKSWYVVPLSLQILIENAIKHNVITSNHILHISVSINEELGQLTVVNSINKKTQTESLGIGLTNLGKRYQLITGRHTASAEDSQQFTVTIPLIESP